MTHQSVPPADTPRELLGTVRDLTRQVRIAQRGTWFPLLVFAAIALGAIPVLKFGPHDVIGTCRSGPGVSFCIGILRAEFVYWSTALLLGYAAIAAFYVRQSRRRGVGTSIRPYIVVGVVIAVVVAAAWLWLATHPLIDLPATPDPSIPIHVGPAVAVVHGLATPLTAIGLALLVLARVERSPALFAFGLVYLVIVLVEGSLPIHSPWPWYRQPFLVPAVVLLLGSVGFALFRPTTERHPR
jgi:hypothetical protein